MDIVIHKWHNLQLVQVRYLQNSRLLEEWISVTIIALITYMYSSECSFVQSFSFTQDVIASVSATRIR